MIRMLPSKSRLFLILTLGLLAPASQAAMRMGDANGNSQVQLNDAVSVQSSILGIGSTCVTPLSAVSDDTKLDIKDVMLIAQYVNAARAASTLAGPDEVVTVSSAPGVVQAPDTLVGLSLTYSNALTGGCMKWDATKMDGEVLSDGTGGAVFVNDPLLEAPTALATVSSVTVAVNGTSKIELSLGDYEGSTMGQAGLFRLDAAGGDTLAPAKRRDVAVFTHDAAIHDPQVYCQAFRTLKQWVDASPGGGGTSFTPTNDGTSGGAQNLDDGYFLLTPPFSLSYFAESFPDVAVSVNGMAIPATGAGDSTMLNGIFLTSPFDYPHVFDPNRAVGVFYTSLYFRAINPFGAMYYRALGAIPNQRYVIQWVNMASNNDVPSASRLTFQVIFEENGVIRYQYEDLAGNGIPPGPSPHLGNAAAIGMEDTSGVLGINWGPVFENKVMPNQALLFTPCNCGNNVLDIGETCDDGNAINDGNGCSEFCQIDGPIDLCGDGYVNEISEECDDANFDNTDDCVNACLVNVCGDGFQDLEGAVTEACDDGNNINEDDCVNTCEVNTCGDGHQDLQGPAIEACDDGNPSELDDCLTTCVPNTCGDGHIDQQGPVTEFCDDGLDNGSGQGFCVGDCSAVQGCGDGIVQGTEQCDDQNLDNNDDCLNSCAFNVCGDGFPDLQAPVVEECDDGNSSNQDDCLNACLANTCGDGFLDLQGPAVETCDDGNLVNEDDCPNTCVPNFCGDGFQDLEGPVTEGCDDGNTSDCDGCRANCSAVETGCGDGFLCGGENCDDGNTENCDGCRGDCSSFEFGCGDGYLCGLEVCDDFNNQDCDGCRGDCSRLDDVCGDLIVDAACGEECDDGNTTDGDGCSKGCYFGCVGAPTVIFSDNFSDGDASNWTHTNFNAPTADLWHVTPGDNATWDAPPNGALWYGDETTGNYAFGDQNVRIASPSFSLPANAPGKSIFLSYADRHSVEGGPFDLLRTGLLLPVVAQLRQVNGEAPNWDSIQINLNAFAGANAQAYYEIDTVDGVANNTFGWKVDAVEVLQCNTCGNSNVESTEECDDGNTATGDGCSSVCLTEATGCTGVERGFFGGSARDVAYFSNRAYVAMGERGLAIWNVTTPSNPVLLGRLDLPDYAQGIAVGSIGGTIHAFVAAGSSGVHVINCGNPAAPVLTATFDTAGYARNLQFASNLVYVADGAGLAILNVAAPAAPSQLSYYPPADYATDVVVFGIYAYVAAEYAGLKVVDVSNPAAPNLVAVPGIGSDSQAIAYQPATNEIHLGDQNDGWIKVGVANPLAPALRWTDPFITPIGLSFNGTTGYVAEGGNGLGVYNVPAGVFPASLQGTYDTQGTLFNVSTNAAMVYGADADGGLVIVNASVPATPALTAQGATLAAANDLLVDGTTLWVGDSSQGVSALDISTPTLAANPSLTAQLGGFAANRIDKAGDYVYAAAGGTGLNIVDVSALPTLTLAGNYNTTGFAYDVKVVGAVAFVADGSSGLVTVDVTAPGAPALLGQYNTTGSAFGVAVAGNVAYLADGSSGLVLVDVSTPSAPSLLGTYNTPSSALDVVVDGIVAFVADNTNGVVAINVANPTAPSLISTYNTAANARSLTLSGNLLNVSDTAGGIVVLDVTDPANMMPQGGYTPKGITYGTAVAGGYLYGATYYAGVTVVDGLAGVCGACGNLVVESPEQCDDGNNMGGDGCSANCLSDETCGNSITDPGEACDDGWLNGYGEGYCLAGCVGVQTCGDGAQNGTEVCDDANTADCDGCRGNCLAVETGCGDTYLCGAEVCDDGNTSNCDGCRGDCSAVETGCGDSFICGVEVCDDGNTDNCSGTCRGDCMAPTGCGDTIVCAPETCEDGNVAPFDGCDSCQLETPTCQPTNVAIFKDAQGWNGGTPNETVLSNAGIPYTIFSSAQFGAVNLSPFDKVIIANEQPGSFYSALMANAAWLGNWVSNGGVLEFHAARNDTTIDGFVMPGGWATSLGSNSELVRTELPNHPAVRLPTPLEEADLEGWNSSLHGAITALPMGSTVYLEVEGGGYDGLPAGAVIPHGSGFSLVSTQTLECAAPGGGCYSPFDNRGEALRNLVLYMPQQSCNCGNGLLDPGETCDDGPSNGLCGFCDNGCKGSYVNTCQDGQVCGGETCDDGNYSNLDDCLNTCVANVCGDAYQDSQGPGTEACDDGNLTAQDGCSGTCLLDCYLYGWNTADEGWTHSAWGGGVDPWHRSSLDAWGGAMSFYMGNDAQQNFDLGLVRGYLFSPVLTVRAGDNLRFWERYAFEFAGFGSYDSAAIDIMDSTGAIALGSIRIDAPDDSTNGAWVSRSYSLAAFVGQQVRIRFAFDSGDGAANNYLGWMVDNVIVGTCSTPSSCSNGLVEPEGGEACDDANGTETDDCRSTCSVNVCGDGFADSEGPLVEVCDDGNTSDCTGACRGDCQAVTGCGDGVACAPEVCDDGAANGTYQSAAPGHCNVGCAGFGAGGFCGDFTTNGGEACDENNVVQNDGCNTSCQFTPILSVHSYAISGGTAGTRGYQDGNIDANEANLSIKVRLRNTGPGTAITPTATTSCPNCASNRFNITNGNLAWPNIAPGAIVESTTHITGSGMTTCNTSATTFTETVSANSLTWNANTTFTTFMRPQIKVGIVDQSRSPSDSCFTGGNNNPWSDVNTNFTSAQSGRYTVQVIRDETCVGGTQNGLPCTLAADETACTGGGGVCTVNNWTDSLTSTSELYYYDTLIFPDNGVMDAYASDLDWWFREGKNIVLIDSAVGSGHCNNWLWSGVTGTGSGTKWNYSFISTNEALEQYLQPFYSAGFNDNELLGLPGSTTAALIRGQLQGGTVAVAADTGATANVRVAYRDVPSKGRVTYLGHYANAYGSFPLRDEELRHMASSLYMQNHLTNTGTSSFQEPDAGLQAVIYSPNRSVRLRDFTVDAKTETICSGGYYNGQPCLAACNTTGICSFGAGPCTNPGGSCNTFGTCGAPGTCPANTIHLYVYSGTSASGPFTTQVYLASYSNQYNDGVVHNYSAGSAAGSNNVLNLTLSPGTYYAIGVGWTQRTRWYYSGSYTSPNWSGAVQGMYSNTGNQSLPSTCTMGSTCVIPGSVEKINTIIEDLGCLNE